MRKYTKEFIVKDWNELTAKQQEKVVSRAYRDDSLMNAYSTNEGELFDIYIDNLKDKYKDLYDDIDLDWNGGTSQGPYIDHRGWTVDLHEYPSEIVDLSDVGIDGEIEVTIGEVYPDHYEFILPDLYHMYLEFDYTNDLDIDESELEDLFEKSANGKAFLKKWAEILSKPLEEYWDICSEYASGFQDIDEWVENEMKDGYLRAVFSVEENGNEVFDDFIWEWD